MIIRHNKNGENALRTMVSNGNQMAKSLEKLSSGFRINRAADDASGLAISEKMRTQIRGLEMSTKNIQHGSLLVRTGDGGLQEVHNLLHRIRELAVQTANGTYQEDDRACIQSEVSQLIEQIDTISKSTHYNGIKLLNGEDWPANTYYENTVRYTSTPSHSTSTTQRVTYEYIRKGGSPPDYEVTTKTQNNTSQNTNTSIAERDGLTMDDWQGSGFSKSVEYVDTVEVETNRDVTTIITERNEDVTAGATTLTNNVRYDGYPQFQTELGDSAIALYCAMTRLDMRVDGVVVSLYSNTATRTTFSPDGKTATTVYRYQDIEVTQTISMTDTNGDNEEDAYSIQLDIENLSDQPKDVDIKFAFDVLNGYKTYSEDGGGSFEPESTGNAIRWDPPDADNIAKFMDNRNGSERVSTLSSAIYDSGFTPPTTMVVDNIEALYYEWDHDDSRSASSSHNAVGYYWSLNMEPEESLKIGCSYGAEFSVDVYRTTVTTTTETETTIDLTETTSRVLYESPEIVIQAGANNGERIPIPLMDVSARMLAIEGMSFTTPDEANAAIEVIDRATNFINLMRSTWGAKEARLNSAFSNNALSGENLQAAESTIRDVDMAQEMMSVIKHELLQQSTQSVLAQAGQLPKNVLTLLG